MNKLQELFEEFKTVFSGRGSRIFDSFLPLLFFLIANSLVSSNFAIWGSLGMAGLLALNRIIQGESLVYALGGIGGVFLASVFIEVSRSEAGFFLPGLISGAIIVVLCVASVAINRPLVAWTSFIARRWPLSWYWHPKVLPVYNEVTIFWAVAFSIRLVVGFWLFQRQAVTALGFVSIFLGWPYTVLLLIISYIYGLWRLGKLGGPSIEEFISGTDPPWIGQKRGF